MTQIVVFADRGFTGHEYLEDFKLYNMNGRLYDPVVGRFLSADPYIQDPSFTQNLNRYSYCLNNPLKFTDPSGEFWNWPMVWFGNWAIGGLDRWINGKQSFKQAFSPIKNPVIFSTNYSPSANQFSHPQIDAQAIVKNQERVWKSLKELEAKYSGAGNDRWDTPWMNRAESQLGVTEIVGIENNSIIIDYHSSTTLGAKDDETAWCSSYVNWSISQVGIKGTNDALAYSWKKWGQTLTSPAYGSIAIANFSHVGFVAGVNDAGRIILLGGNQGQPGAVSLSPINASSIVQYVYPTGYIPSYILPVRNINRSTLNYNFTH